MDCTPELGRLVQELVVDLQSLLHGSLEGIYLFGSLASGDFDPAISDIDLLVALSEDADDAQLQGLRDLHEAFALRHPAWADRVDANYLSLEALRSCKDRLSSIVVITPGEPLHRTQTSPGWLMNWYMVREQGIALLGPPPRSIIAPIDEQDFLAAVADHMREMPGRTDASRSPTFHAYAVLTSSRALYALRHREQASKRRAARWLAETRPGCAKLVETALAVRSGARLGEPAKRDFASAARDFVRRAATELMESFG